MGADVIDETLKNIMQAALSYEKSLTCVNGSLADPSMNRRVEWVTVMLARYLKEEDWDHVRFSGEMHFSRGPEMQLRQPGG